MKFDALTYDRPVLLLANGMSLQMADQDDLERLAGRCFVVAINGAGRVKPNVRFFLDDPQCENSREAFARYGKRGELWAGRQSTFPNTPQGMIDYEVEDYMTPWNNSFLAALYIICNTSDVTIYVLGGDCNPEYAVEVLWGEDYKTIVGISQGFKSIHMREHFERTLDSSKREVSEIDAKFPGRIISLCGDYSRLPLEKKTLGELKSVK